MKITAQDPKSGKTVTFSTKRTDIRFVVFFELKHNGELDFVRTNAQSEEDAIAKATASCPFGKDYRPVRVG